jgi:sugar/nucleoside kinase (ribokinase family)
MLAESALRSAKLCVVGNINRDIKTAPLSPGGHIFEDGETAIDAVLETIGGGGANCAAVAAALGAPSSFIGQVGDDELGRRLEEVLTRAGVDCHLRRVANLATGTTVNLVYDTGRRHFLSCHPNNGALTFETLDLAPLARADHLLRADVWFSDAMLYGGNERLFSAARDARVPVSIDLNWDPKWGRALTAEIERRKAAVREVLPFVELAHGNIRGASSSPELRPVRALLASPAGRISWGPVPDPRRFPSGQFPERRYPPAFSSPDR